MKVTILTPTYNRGYTLKKLYNSLINQTNKNFIWLVIDDGSTDDTRNLINLFMEEKKIKIEYHYQKNGGKHRALNYGISLIKSEITFIVDSDDWITNDAIETILKYFRKYKNDENIGVISFLKAYPDFKINGPQYSKDEYRGNYIEDRLNKNNWGDKAEVCYTNVLKKYPLPEIEKEKFISEGYLWVKMALDYDSIYVNKVIYIADYLQDGLTNNIYKMRIKNPKGCIEVAKMACNDKANLKIKYKNMIKYIAYSLIDKRKFYEIYRNINYKFIFITSFIPGILFEKYIMKKNGSE